MSFSHLPPELLTNIFVLLDPPSLFHLCLTSSTCYNVIKRHEGRLCRAIAARHTLPQYPHLASIPPVQWLQVRWHRHQLNTALSSTVDPADLGWKGRHQDLVPAFRHALDILWTYGDAMEGKLVEPAADPLRNWINTTSLEKIDVMSMHVSMYAGMLMRLSPHYGREETDPMPAHEMALTKGIPFLVAALVDGAEEAVGVVRKAYAPESAVDRGLKSAVRRLDRERNRKVGVIESLLGVVFERAGGPRELACRLT